MRRHVSTRPKKSARTVSLRVESLETRQLLNADPISSVSAAPVATIGLISREVGAPIGPLSTAFSSPGVVVSGPLMPALIRHAYGVDQLSYDGTGQTIAIVDAFDDPTIANDLTTFDQRFGLPAANLVKATPQGTPTVDTGWAVEISLDVEWAHVIAPNAKILLVEATAASDGALLNAVDYAVNQGAQQVSMSWGGGEFFGQSTLDSHFNRPGVTFLASAGDNGAGVSFPAVSPYVTGVGGTTLSLDASGNKLSETAWSGSGGGTSVQNALPAFQKGFQNDSFRGVPDVSYDADSASGVYVYYNGGWNDVGGTSVGAPQWAGLVALANQGLAAAGKPSLGTGQTYGTNTLLYQLAGGTSYTNAGGDFQDITSGSNGNSATVGYDTVTGLGSPVANKLIPDLVGPVTPPPPSVPTVGNAGFEQTSIGLGYEYNPRNEIWTFAGTSGVTGNNFALTSQNPPAPQGTEVGILQMTGIISQSVSGWAAGTYQISFDAANRGNNGGHEDFEVTVDGTVVGTFLPSGTSYQTMTTASFAVTAGAHTIAFVGLDTIGGDNTAFLDAVAVQTATAGTPQSPAPPNSPPPPPPPPPPPSGSVPTVGNAGFEQTSIGLGYEYNPRNEIWTFAGTSGVTGNNFALTSQNPPAPQGTEVGILQMTGIISQSVSNWAAGTYQISFDAANRGNNGGHEDFEVTVDGTVVGTFLPSGTSYQTMTTASFAVTAGAHTIAFVGLDTIGGDNTAFLDAVAVQTATAGTPQSPAPPNSPPPPPPPPPPPSGSVPTVGNAGFEQTSIGLGYEYNPRNEIWTFAGTSGVTGNNFALTSQNPPAPQGTEVGILQMTGIISQSVSNWAAGTYQISFDAANRGNNGGHEDFEVTVDGTVVGTFLPSGTSYQTMTTASFAVTAGAHTIAFVGLDTIGGDNTAFLDAIAVSGA